VVDFSAQGHFLGHQIKQHGEGQMTAQQADCWLINRKKSFSMRSKPLHDPARISPDRVRLSHDPLEISIGSKKTSQSLCKLSRTSLPRFTEGKKMSTNRAKPSRDLKKTLHVQRTGN
jgi:hypothetical protein